MKLKSNCEASSLNFQILKHHIVHFDEYLNKPFQVIPYNLNVEMPSFSDFKELKTLNSNFSQIATDIRQENLLIKKDLADNSDIDQENTLQLKTLDNTLIHHKQLSWTSFSVLGLAVICIIGVVVWLVISRKNHAFTNIKIKQESKDNIDTTTNKGHKIPIDILKTEVATKEVTTEEL